MARRKPSKAPIAAANDPRRHTWTIGSLRIFGFFRLPEGQRQAWTSAWQHFADHEGPCPIAPPLLDDLVARWPKRERYAEAVEAWRAGAPIA